MELDLKKYKNKRICVAVSGGVDSMVLLYLMKEYEQKYEYSLSAVNFEHGIRGEDSEEDSRFVQEICDDLGVPVYAFKEDCLKKASRDKLSLETAARNFRREYYEKLLNEGETDFIATAHHANDESETVLFRLARGSALAGASGIKKEDGRFIRPLIDKTKEEILAFAKQRKIAYREDSTNFERVATRNIIRLDILPKLEEILPNATRNIARFARLASEDDEFLYELSNDLILFKVSEAMVKISDKKPLFTRACLTVLKRFGVDKDYTFTHLDDLFSLQNLRIGAKISLPKELIAMKTEDGIFFSRKKEIQEIVFEPIPFQVGEFRLGDYQITVSLEEPSKSDNERILRLDKDKLPNDCVFRQRKEGDLFRKYGGGRKTLKRYLIDKKIAVEKRDMPLIAQENGDTVYAIFGVEISEEVKITNETKTIVYLKVKDKRR